MSDPNEPGPSWPRVSYEELPWHIDDAGLASRTARRRHRGPYRAAIVPPIAHHELGLPSETAALVEDAAAEIIRFDAEQGRELAPFSSVLLRTESVASSKIENLSASARAIAQAELGTSRREIAKIIVANTRAMTAAIRLASRLDRAAILEMHDALLSESNPSIAGRWRDEQVWIGGGDLGPHHALFVPPQHVRVVPAIDDLLAYIDRDDVPILAHAAIAHAQFETIHPFPDGNGRTGRALLHAHIRNKGLTRHLTIPLSAGLLTDTSAYFDALTQYRDGEPLAMIERLAAASFSAVGNGRRLVDELHEIRAGWQERITARRGAHAWRLVDLLLAHPVVNAALVARELGIDPKNSYRTLQPLVDAGIVVESTDRRRNQEWSAIEVLDALDRFASRAGRRTLGR